MVAHLNYTDTAVHYTENQSHVQLIGDNWRIRLGSFNTQFRTFTLTYIAVTLTKRNGPDFSQQQLNCR